LTKKTLEGPNEDML